MMSVRCRLKVNIISGKEKAHQNKPDGTAVQEGSHQPLYGAGTGRRMAI